MESAKPLRLRVLPLRPGTLPRRIRSAERRALRRLAALLCLVFAFYCLLAAAVTLGGQLAPAAMGATSRAQSARPGLPLLILAIALIFTVVIAAVTRREGWRPGVFPAPRRASRTR